jgi:hypothetical protein
MRRVKDKKTKTNISLRKEMEARCNIRNNLQGITCKD